MKGSFTFAAGNLRKLVLAPFYLIGNLLALITPRDPNRWVVGSGTGLACGPESFARLAMTEQGRTVTWLAASTREWEEARRRGLHAVPKTSLAGFWATLRAGVCAITHGFGDVNRFASKGAFVVHLGHGTPIKLLHLDSPVTTTLQLPVLGRVDALERGLRALYRRASRRLGVVIAPSAATAQRLASAYEVPVERVAITGDPRLDVLAGVGTEVDASAGVTRALLDQLGLGELPPGGLILYAPTWRDGKVDPPGPGAHDLAALEALLKTSQSVLVLRSHPLGFTEADVDVRRSGRITFLSSADWPDITPALAAFATLVTDYSAICIDYSVTERPIVFFGPDVENYAATRGFYEPYEDLTESSHSEAWAGVVAELTLLAGDESFAEARRARTRRLRQRFVEFHDGHNTQRVLAAIAERR